MSESTETIDSKLQALAEKPRLSVDEAKLLITQDQIKSLEILSFFFYQIGQFDSSLRTAKAILVIDSTNTFATNMQVLCADALEQFATVVELTEDIYKQSFFDSNLTREQYKSLLLLRARALHKLKLPDEAKACLQKLSLIKQN